MEKIEKFISEKAKEREALIGKGSQAFAEQAMKLNLWKLDKKTAGSELKSIAEKYKTI